MYLAFKIIKFLIAFFLAAVGAFGVPKDWATQDEVRNWIYTFLTNYYGQGIATYTGVLLLSLCIAEEITKQQIKKLDGNRKANFIEWDKVQKISVWQVAWLWQDLEPQDKNPVGGAAYPVFQWLKEALEKKLIKNAEQVNDSWIESRLNRQDLVDYAIKKGERPKFLYPNQRKFWLIKFLKNFIDKNGLIGNATDYLGVSQYYMALHENMTVTEVNAQLMADIKIGKATAIGRPKRDGIFWQHELIPKNKIDEVSGLNFFYGADYSDIKIKYRKTK